MLVMNGTTGPDVLEGMEGDDVLNGLEGDDTLSGMGGDDTLNGGPGNDTLDGGDGTDLADYSGAAAGAQIDLAAGTAQDGDGGVDTLISIEGAIGSAQADSFQAGAGPNLFIGGAGDDVITGNGQTRISYAAATDAIIADLATNGVSGDASVGTDTVSGIGTVVGTAFNDALLGSNATPAQGFEGFEGLAGNDLIDGRGGVDRAIYAGSDAAVVVDLSLGQATEDGFGGTDVLFAVEEVEGSDFDDQLTGDSNANRLIGGAGDDTLIGGAGADALDGGDGTDTADYSAAPGAVVANLAAGTVEDGTGATDSIANVENIIGGTGDDELTGDAEANVLTGGAGADILSGGAGADTLNGGAGMDTADYSNAAGPAIFDLTPGQSAFFTVTEADGAIDRVRTDVETIVGTPFADMVLPGGAAFDGGAGRDRLDLSGFGAGLTVNFALGQILTGQTTLVAPTNVEDVTGSDFADNLTGDANANTLNGQGGADVLVGGGGRDSLIGADGDDRIIWNNGDGSDAIDGGAGTDTVVVNGSTTDGDQFALTADGDGVDFARTNLTPFQLDIANVEALEVNGLGGDDRLEVGDLGENALSDIAFSGGDGDDTLAGAAATGALVADGGAGDDMLVGGEGDDQLLGGSGDDVLRGGPGDDLLNGGAGIDRADFSDADAGVTIDIDAGTAADGQGGTDTFAMANGAPTIEGAIGSDFDDTLISGRFAYFNGGPGFDVVDLFRFAAAVNVNLTNSDVTSAGATVGLITDVERVIATGFADSLTGGAADDVLDGAGGDDTILGGEGDDRLIGGAGNDVIDGGLGVDIADYSTASAGVTIDIFNDVFMDGDGGVDTVTNVEGVMGSAFDDDFIGSIGDDMLFGGAGTDRLNGRQGADMLAGGDGSDVYFVDDVGDVVIETAGGGDRDRVNTIVDMTIPDNVEFLVGANRFEALTLTGSDGFDRITGTNLIFAGDVIMGGGSADRLVGLVGDDQIFGGDFADRIFGNSGDDLIVGGDGGDRLTGQFGADTFGQNPGDDADRITDFDVTQDILDLRGHGIADFNAFQGLISDTADGALIDLGNGDSILLQGVAGDTVGQEDVLLQ